MKEEERAPIKLEFLNWCRQMRVNAILAVAGAEDGARLILIDPGAGQLDVTEADADWNRRSVAILDRYFAAEGVSPHVIP
jgi:hypothetical protein